MPKAIIIYETSKGSTQRLAEAVQEGLEQSGVKTTIKRISEVSTANLLTMPELYLVLPPIIRI